MNNQVERCEIEIGGKKVIFELGAMGRQANGAASVRIGDTVVFVAAVCGKKPRAGFDFFPLTVDYRERTYAAGRIPGGFLREKDAPARRKSLPAG